MYTRGRGGGTWSGDERSTDRLDLSTSHGDLLVSAIAAERARGLVPGLDVAGAVSPCVAACALSLVSRPLAKYLGLRLEVPEGGAAWKFMGTGQWEGRRKEGVVSMDWGVRVCAVRWGMG